MRQANNSLQTILFNKFIIDKRKLIDFIISGANLSGDLKDPASAIPKGTLLAITITYITYIGYAVMMGSCALREASGNLTEYNMTMLGEIDPTIPGGFMAFDNCTNRECEYGMYNSAQVSVHIYILILID
jgi:hypothetical protein